MGIIGRTLGHYKLLEEIGSGGFATVYLGLDTRDNEPVAVKVLLDQSGRDPTALARFEREALALSKLPTHPNIVGLRDYGKANGYQFLVMDYAAGSDLSAELHRRGKLPVVEAVDIAVQVVSALSAAFDAGIVHRDIKPENIRLLPDQTIKLLDFGIARDASTARITQAGLLAGTAPYVAPEVWQGRTPDHLSDIYALGCVLYEMLVGCPPFAAATPEATMNLHLQNEPDMVAVSNVGAPAGVCDVIEHMLAKDPSARPATGDLLDKLPPYGRSRKTPPSASARISVDPGAAEDAEKTRANLRQASQAKTGAKLRRGTAGLIAAVLLSLAAGLLLGALAVGSIGLPAAIELRARALEPTAAAAARAAAVLFRGTPAAELTGTLPAAAAAAVLPAATAATMATAATTTAITTTLEPAPAPAITAAPTHTAVPKSIYSLVPNRLRKLPSGQAMDWYISVTSPGLSLDPSPDSPAGKRIWGNVDSQDPTADYDKAFYTIRAGDPAEIVWSMDIPLQPGFYEVFAYRPTHFRDYVAVTVPYQVYLDDTPLQPFTGTSIINQQTQLHWISLGGYEITSPGILSVRLNAEAARPVSYEVDVDSLGIVELDGPKLASQP